MLNVQATFGHAFKIRKHAIICPCGWLRSNGDRVTQEVPIQFLEHLKPIYKSI